MAQQVVLISCSKKKTRQAGSAAELYCSTLFRLSLSYAFQLKPSVVYVLSAKHGLVSLDQHLAPYDLTLNDLNSRQRLDWAEKVIRQLETVANLADDRFIFLAGNKYYRDLLSHLAHVELPLAGLGIGQRLKRLKELQHG